MARREFLMLGKVYDPDKHDVSGYWLSEKLDGVRCYWDGGLSRDIPTNKVPWAGLLNPDTGQIKTKIRKMATGLWSRYGNPIVAPDWFLNQLPCVPLDGELYMGRGMFQKTVSAVKKEVPIDEEWANIKYPIFGCPNLWDTMQDGEIKNAQMLCDISKARVEKFLKMIPRREDWLHLEARGGVPFAAEIANLNNWLDPSSELIYLITQTKLPDDRIKAREEVARRAVEIMKLGGEGLILRDPNSVWTPRRVDAVLKVKACLDATGIVIGFTSGRLTGRGSKLLGKIGALILDFDGKRLELSGLTHEEREFATEEMSRYAADYAGKDMPPSFQGKYFKVGDRVNFLYRELTDGGLPKEARFDRVRSEHD